jgi:hypothetical protein
MSGRWAGGQFSPIVSCAPVSTPRHRGTAFSFQLAADLAEAGQPVLVGAAAAWRPVRFAGAEPGQGTPMSGVIKVPA